MGVEIIDPKTKSEFDATPEPVDESTSVKIDMTEPPKPEPGEKPPRVIKNIRVNG